MCFRCQADEREADERAKNAAEVDSDQIDFDEEMRRRENLEDCLHYAETGEDEDDCYDADEESEEGW